MLLKKLQGSLMPARCIFCNVWCKYPEVYICCSCVHDLPWRNQLTSNDMPPLAVVAAPFDYAFPIDAALKLLKFHRRLDYVPGLAEILAQSLDQLPAGIDAILPMPLHWRRLAIRGYNQARELARAIHQRSRLPLVPGVRRVRLTAYQSGLNAVARKRNLHKAFAASEPIVAKHVLIIDDVITTGESCRQLAKVLLDAGAAEVSALAVARSRTSH